MAARLATANLVDANMALLAMGDLRVLQPVFNIYGQKRRFHGQVVTMKLLEDNMLLKQMLGNDPPYGAGSVLVVDSGGIQRSAVMGENLVKLGCEKGWKGIIVNGYIGDVDEINSCEIGIRALGAHPLKSGKKGDGEKCASVFLAGTLIRDGEWLYADADGVLVSRNPLSHPPHDL